MNKPIDFTNCRRLPGRAYNGANGKKIAVAYEGESVYAEIPAGWRGENPRSCPILTVALANTLPAVFLIFSA